MADKVHITKAGIKAFEWDGEIRQYVEQPSDSAISLLRCACHVDSDVTLADIFNILESDGPLLSFIGMWSTCDPQVFHAEMRKPAKKRSDFLCIEVSKHFEWNSAGAQEVLDVSGVSEKPDEHGCTHYALDFTPVNELGHLPIRLNPTMEIREDWKKIGEGECSFSLLDVLGEIYYEISFHGSPEDRDERMEELQASMKAVQDGTATPVPFEEAEEPVQ